MEQIQTSQLRKHPRNYEFFDDISGERWKDFKESIMRRGVVEPIVVTQDLLVVSGHQRIRACEELGINEIPCRITFYPEYDEKIKRTKEDMILEDLICTNIMQRGVGNVNPMKMARCIIELERIKGIQNGGYRGNQYKVADGNNFDVANQKELANELNISQRQLGNYKKLTKLIPELQQMIEDNEVKATIGYKVYAKLSKEEQEKFLNEIGKDKIKELTQKATKELIEEKRKLEQALVEEKNKPPKVVTEVVDKTDYVEINKLREEKRNLQMKCMKLKNKVEKSDEEDLKREIENLKYLIKNKDKEIREMEEMKKELNENRKLVAKFTGESTNLELISTTSKNKKRMMDFLDEMSKYDYLAETFNEIPRATRSEWLKGVRAIYKWSNNILSVIDEVESVSDNNLVIDTNFEIEMK